MIYRELNDFDKSLKCFNESIKINPNFDVAYNNLGIVLRDLGKSDEAEKNFLKSIDLNPKNSDPYNNLGLIYKEKDLKKAQVFFEKSLEINPKNFLTLNNIGNLYKKNEKVEIAEKFFNDAISINKFYFDSYNNLMDLYDKTNQNKKLLFIINTAKKIFSSNKIIDLFYGLYLYKNKNYDEAITVLNNLSFKNKNELNRERLRCLILAKSYDKNKIYDSAFDFYVITNKINLEKQSSDINKYRSTKIITERIIFYKNNILKLNQNNTDLNEKQPVFMIGFPRSGTTLLDTILRSHTSVEVIEEQPLVSDLITSLHNYTNNNLDRLSNLTEEQIILLQNQYFESLLSISKHNSNKIIIDKLPLNIIYTGEILKIFPKAKFITSIRNPFDSVLSCYMQSFKLNDAMANFLNLEDAAIMYNNVMKLWNIYKNKIDFNYQEVKYEDIIHNFENTIEKILKFINLGWSDNISKFYETATKRSLISTPSYDQVNQPLYTSSIDRWKNYKNNIKNIIPILNPWLKEFNYKN